LLDKVESVEQAPGEQRNVVVDIGEALLRVGQEVETQRADAGVPENGGESVVARLGVGLA
jgi:hypothetical protein